MTRVSADWHRSNPALLLPGTSELPVTVLQSLRPTIITKSRSEAKAAVLLKLYKLQTNERCSESNLPYSMLVLSLGMRPSRGCLRTTLLPILQPPLGACLFSAREMIMSAFSAALIFGGASRAVIVSSLMHDCLDKTP
eukprot:5518596-Pleurochrysis_carterae.AAC.1